MASILMPQPDLPFEGGIKIDATRLKPAFVLAFWRQNGANCRCFLTSGAKTEPISCETSSHHPTATFEPPKRHSISRFFKNLSLLLYRNIQSQKVNTASKSFLKSPLFLYRNIERKIFNINFKNAANAPHSLTATSEANKRHQFLKVPRIFTN